MKRQLCSIATPDVRDILARRIFVSHSRNLKASTQLIADIWCIGFKKAKSNLEATPKRGTGSAILPLSRRYKSNKVYRLKRLKERFATDTLLLDINSLNQYLCEQVFSHKVGLSET